MRWFLVMIIFCSGLLVQSQVVTDSLFVKDKALGYGIYQGPMLVGPNRISVLMKHCNAGLAMYSGGKQMEAFGVLMSAVGLATAGAAAGNYFFNGRAREQAFLILPGLVVMGAGIPLYYGGEKRVKLGVAYYNQHCVGH